MPYVQATSADSGTTSGVIWTTWNVTNANTITTYTHDSTNLTATPIWSNWNSTYVDTSATFNTYTVTSTSAAVWTHWQNSPYSAPRYARQIRVETEEERIAALAQAELRRQAYELRQAQRAMAIEKADKLLDSVLSDVQREHLAKHDWFLLKGQNGTIYRIRKGRSGNVDVLSKDGVVIERLCAHPEMNVPDGDTMVAQKLALESEEKMFLRLANRHQIAGPRVPREIMDAFLN